MLTHVYTLKCLQVFVATSIPVFNTRAYTRVYTHVQTRVETRTDTQSRHTDIHMPTHMPVHIQRKPSGTYIVMVYIVMALYSYGPV